jgi:hypothetical protein
VSVVVEAPSRTQRPELLEITISKELASDEIEYPYTDRVVEVVEAIIGLWPKPALPRGSYGVIDEAEKTRIETQFRSFVIQTAYELYLKDPGATRSLREGPFYALYSFAVFRFNLRMGDMSDLSSLLINRGETHRTLLILCERGLRSRQYAELGY